MRWQNAVLNAAVADGMEPERRAAPVSARVNSVPEGSRSVSFMVVIVGLYSFVSVWCKMLKNREKCWRPRRDSNSRPLA
jgi:hypothetical protein